MLGGFGASGFPGASARLTTQVRTPQTRLSLLDVPTFSPGRRHALVLLHIPTPRLVPKAASLKTKVGPLQLKQMMVLYRGYVGIR